MSAELETVCAGQAPFGAAGQVERRNVAIAALIGFDANAETVGSWCSETLADAPFGHGFGWAAAAEETITAAVDLDAWDDDDDDVDDWIDDDDEDDLDTDEDDDDDDDVEIEDLI